MTVELIILCLVLLAGMYLYNFLFVQKGVAVPNVYTWNIVNLFDCITLKFSKIAHQHQEKLFRLICLVFKGYVVNDVDYAKQIYLLKNKFVMHPNTHAGFASLIPNAILSLPSSTPQWAAQHKVLSSCFTDKYLESTHNAMVESINRLVNKWTEEIQQSPSKSINRDVKGDIEELSMDILMNVLVGLKWGELSEGKRSELKDAINIFVLELYNRMNPMLPYRNTEKLRNAMKLLRDSVKETMVKSSAKEANKERNTMVSLLLQARENDEEMFTDAAVEDALLVLQFAAHETSTSGIIAALMAFADFKGASDEMRNQFKDATPSVKEILGTRYVDNFVNEVLRYYPIIGITGRIATDEHTFDDGTVIPKDSFVFIPFYKFHKEKAIWGEDADQFVPERFNAKNSPHHKGHVFTPFGLGERQCLGKRLAQVELKIVSALLAQKFNFELTTKYEDLPMNQRISVQPEIVPMKITLREELLQSSA